jgi:hypothetical protein
MIDHTQARQLALVEINQPHPHGLERLEMVLLDAFTIEEDFGWVFFYDSKLHQETDDVSYALAGNGSIIINRYTGEIRCYGTACSPEFYISQYREHIVPGAG